MERGATPGGVRLGPGPTWLQGVLDVEHGRPVAVHHVLLNLVFGNVAASVLYPDARLQVVEVAAVELEELDEQDADVDVGTGHVLPVMKLGNTQAVLCVSDSTGAEMFKYWL